MSDIGDLVSQARLKGLDKALEDQILRDFSRPNSAKGKIRYTFSSNLDTRLLKKHYSQAAITQYKNTLQKTFLKEQRLQERIDEKIAQIAKGDVRLRNTPGDLAQQVRVGTKIPPSLPADVIKDLKVLKSNQRGVNKAVQSALVRRVSDIVSTHRNLYLSFLSSLSGVFSNDDLDMHGSDFTIQARVGSDVASVGVSWRVLSKATIAQKEQDPTSSRRFWKHTGKLARAFRSAVESQRRVPLTYSRGNRSAFYTEPRLVETQDPSKNFSVKGFKLGEIGMDEYNIHFNLTLPEVKGNKALEEFITVPYLTGRRGLTARQLFQPKDRLRNAQIDQEMDNLRKQRESLLHQEQSAIRSALQEIAELKQSRKQLKASGGRTSGVTTRINNKTQGLETLKANLAARKQALDVQEVNSKLKEQTQAWYRNNAPDDQLNLNRIIAPEQSRPFVSRLSIAAGKIARERLKQM